MDDDLQGLTMTFAEGTNVGQLVQTAGSNAISCASIISSSSLVTLGVGVCRGYLEHCVRLKAEIIDALQF